MLIDLDPLFRLAFGVKLSCEGIDKGRVERAIWMDESERLRQVMPHWNGDEIKTKRAPGCERVDKLTCYLRHVYAPTYNLYWKIIYAVRYIA